MSPKNHGLTNEAPPANNPARKAVPQKARPGVEKGTILRLLTYIRQDYFGRFILVLICILASTAASVAGSLFLQILFDKYITPLTGQQHPVFTGLLQAIMMMALIYLAGIVATYLYNRLMVVIAQGVMKKIRDELFSHMQTLPIRYFDTHPFGEIMSCYTNDIDTLRQMLTQSLPQMFASLITIVAVLVAMLATSIPLTAVVLLVLVIMLLVTKSIGGNSMKYFIQQQQDLGRINGYIEEMINGQKVIKVFCHEPQTIAQFASLNESLYKSATSANRFANILMPVLANLGTVQYVLIAIAGGALAVSGLAAISLGTIASFLQLSRTFSMPIGQISQQINAVVMALAGAGRIFALMDEIPETDEGYVTLVNTCQDGSDLCEVSERTGRWAWKHPHGDGTVTYTELKGDVRLFNVDFSYDGQKMVLNDVSLYAEPGHKIAFVGATGAGKTTITNLINRFYDIADGKIRYDGININKICKRDLRRSLGMVLQDTALFTGTVKENIRYGKLNATDEEVCAAARRANADGFIRMLPQGYNTLLTGDGSGLSQGQRQLLSIARAEVADTPVMILDEATSSIDTRTEAIVQRGMDALMQGRTVFVIAHRLSTVQNADAILVINQGRIVERGSHEDLIAQHGEYYQLYTGTLELE